MVNKGVVYNSVKENSKGYFISLGVVLLSTALIHKFKFRTPPFYYDVLLSKLTLAPFLLFGLMVMIILMLGDKE